MKQITKQDRQKVLKDRWWVGLVVVNALIAIIVVVALIIMIQPKEMQVITRFSAFDATPGFYRGYWYSLFGYVVFELVILVGHVLASLKLYCMERRDLALALLWITLGISIGGLLLAKSVINLASIG